MCGILAEMGARYGDAETYLEGATCARPGSVVAWTVFGKELQNEQSTSTGERGVRTPPTCL